MRPLRVFHAFSGLDSWGKPFREAGAQVITLDWDPAFNADLVMDIRLFAKDPQRYLDEVALAKGWIRPGEHWLVDVACFGPDCQRDAPAGWNAGRKDRKAYGAQLDPRKLLRDGKGRGMRHPAALTNHQRGQDDPAPLANSARAAALRSIVPRELVVEWRDAVLRDFRALRASRRQPRPIG